MNLDMFLYYSGESDELDDLQRTPYFHNNEQAQPNIGLLPSLPRPPSVHSGIGRNFSDNYSLENNDSDEPLKITVTPYQEVGGCHRPPGEVSTVYWLDFS